MQNILFFGDSLTAGYGFYEMRQQNPSRAYQQKINNERLDIK